MTKLAALPVLLALLAGCSVSQIENAVSRFCPGATDDDFIAYGADICYKPAYKPSPRAFAEAKERLPDRVKAKANQDTYDALVDRRCPGACQPPTFRRCPTETKLVGVGKDSEGRIDDLKTVEIPDPDCVEENDWRQAAADRRCAECKQTVTESCMDDSGGVLAHCIRPGDPLEERELAATLEREARKLDSLYERLIRKEYGVEEL